MAEPWIDELCSECKEMHKCIHLPRAHRIKMLPTEKCKKPRLQGPGTPGSPFMPSNGTEGQLFIADWCERCLYNNRAEVDREVEIGCPILDNSFRTDYGKGPSQWVHGEDGWGSCTMFDPRKPLESERRWSAQEERERYAAAMRGE